MAEILVVDRTAFFGGDWPQGFVPVGAAERSAFLTAAGTAARFVDRPTAERNPAWKQWIPYCVLRCGRPGQRAEGVFLVQRTNGQTEARLHGQWSVGLGGHVDAADAGDMSPANGASFFLAALRRELAEELRIDLDRFAAPTFLGLLNDDGTAVGQVHAGLVYRLDLPCSLAAARESVEVREISKMRGGFASLVEFYELWQDRPRFESWSQLLVDAVVAAPMGDSA